VYLLEVFLVLLESLLFLGQALLKFFGLVYDIEQLLFVSRLGVFKQSFQSGFQGVDFDVLLDRLLFDRRLQFCLLTGFFTD